MKNKYTSSNKSFGGTKDDNISIILEQWKTCVDMANTVSQRRDTMNNWFITLNIGMFITLSVNCDIKSILGSILGIVLCLIWLGFIRNYKKLNTEKFKIINDMEKRLPEQPFEREWRLLNDSPRYLKFTTLEQYLAWIFIVIYLLLFAFSTPEIGGKYILQYLYHPFVFS